jgi:quercetin dioxygenase-like cupin family protein
MDTMSPTSRGLEVSGPTSGRHYHFLNHLASVKVAAEGSRSMSVVQFEAVRGFGPPLHRHEHEDELFVILHGELRYTYGDETIEGGTGSIAYLPAARPHTFQVVSETAVILNVCASRTGAPRFDEMVASLGVPTDPTDLPDDQPIDPGHVAAVCAEYDITILGPPPAPLDGTEAASGEDV